MSKPHRAYEQNVPGRFCVDDRCIACMLCAEIAPEIFIRDAEQEHVFVGRQPVLEEEIDRCKEVKDICPVDAIGERAVATYQQ